MNRYGVSLFCLFFISASSNADVFHSHDYFIELLKTQVTLSESIQASLRTNVRSSKITHDHPAFHNSDLAIYEHFPQLSNSLPRVALGSFPTPISYLSVFSAQCGNGAHVYIKRDDLTGCMPDGQKEFGGNKIRKLEFLLADALWHDAQTVMTYGCIGSNHATATASCARRCGLRCINLLKPQPLSFVVQRNLLLMHEYGAQMILNPNNEVRALQTICSFFQNKYLYGDLPYLIPTGGSNEIGAIGYVNAAFELKDQIDRGELPMPDYIYIPVGSCGTASGFLVGARAAGITARIKLIAVEHEETFPQQIITLCKSVACKLGACDNSFPQREITSDDFEVILNFAGERYGQATQEGDRVAHLLRETEGIVLDGTYSAKAFSGMMYDLEHTDLQGKTILFLHTFCNYIEPQNTDFNDLAPAFYQFFNE